MKLVPGAEMLGTSALKHAFFLFLDCHSNALKKSMPRSSLKHFLKELVATVSTNATTLLGVFR